MNGVPRGSLGQFLVLKLDATRWSASVERAICRYAPTGIFLSRIGSPDATAELLAKIAGVLASPPLLWVEEEGGQGDPLRACFPALPSPVAAAARGLAAVEQLGELIGSALRLLALNANCAPRLDIPADSAAGDQRAGHQRKPVISDCGKSLTPASFGSDPHQVAGAGKAFVRGLRRHGILACGKHFPGLGASHADPSTQLPVVGKSMSELWHRDLVPYREMLPQLFAVLMSHAAYKAYDFDILCPAWRSANVVQGLLRTKLGFGGLAVADLSGLARPAASEEQAERSDSAVRSMAAGCDLVIVDAGQAEDVQSAVARALETGRILATRLDESYERLRAARRSLKRPPGKLRKADADRLARQFEEFARSLER